MPGVSDFAQNSSAQTFWIALAFVSRFEQPLNHAVDRELQTAAQQPPSLCGRARHKIIAAPRSCSRGLSLDDPVAPMDWRQVSACHLIIRKW